MMTKEEARDWLAWHRQYDDSTSRLARRLRVVQGHVRREIDRRSGELQIISMCAGQGRDLLGVLSEHPRRGDIAALLVELDPRNVEIAKAAAGDAGLDRVQVLCGDASITDSYTGAVPADIVLACGVFGNISDDDIMQTIAYLPRLCAPGAAVIWTRAHEADRDIVSTIRRRFEQAGFEEIAFDAPANATFRVGVHRLTVSPQPSEPGVRLFRFIR
jgi:predicted RNA methylase